MTNPEPILQPGFLVTYYLEGWRSGHIETIKGQTASIRPIAPKGKILRLVRIPVDELKIVEPKAK